MQQEFGVQADCDKVYLHGDWATESKHAPSFVKNEFMHHAYYTKY